VTLVESWNGTSWSVATSPSPGSRSYLDGVSCVSADACTAVGTQANTGNVLVTLVESWNGTSWSAVPSPSPSPGYGDYLDGVSCASASACTAVGQRSTTDAGAGKNLVESWNGTSWSVATSPNRGTSDNFTGVSCTSADACTAAGVYVPSRGGHATEIESWNGTSWSVVSSPNRGNNSELNGVSCVSADACTAAGFSTTAGTEDTKTLVESGS
jgi:hypothetical protein